MVADTQQQQKQQKQQRRYIFELYQGKAIATRFIGLKSESLSCAPQSKTPLENAMNGTVNKPANCGCGGAQNSVVFESSFEIFICEAIGILRNTLEVPCYTLLSVFNMLESSGCVNVAGYTHLSHVR